MRYCTTLLFLLLLISPSIHAQNYPDNGWQFNQEWDLDGWTDELYTEFQPYIIDSTTITGLMIIQDGKVIFEYGDIEENSYIASCRKSILAILYGKYVKDGTIDLDLTLEELGIDDVTPLLAIEKRATIRDLISARSGVFLSGSNPGDFRQFAPERGSVKPGEFWLYSNWDFNLAGHLFEQLTGKNIYDEVEAQLAIPLGMEDWDRSLQKKYGDSTLSLYPAYHMWFSTRDLARIGWLMESQGKWKQTQVIDKDWLSEMIQETTTAKEVVTNVPFFDNRTMITGYGYMWWLWDQVPDPRLQGAYSALGAWGQTITVYPEIGVALAVKTNSIYQRGNRGGILEKVIEMAPTYYNKELGLIKRKVRDSFAKGEFKQATKKYNEYAKTEGSVNLENYFNRLGYQFMQQGNIESAIAVFKLNTEAYPASWNVFDSLGEAYALNGDTKMAIENYKKSVELNPNNQNAIQRLKILKE